MSCSERIECRTPGSVGHLLPGEQAARSRLASSPSRRFPRVGRELTKDSFPASPARVGIHRHEQARHVVQRVPEEVQLATLPGAPSSRCRSQWSARSGAPAEPRRSSPEPPRDRPKPRTRRLTGRARAAPGGTPPTLRFVGRWPSLLRGVPLMRSDGANETVPPS
jgi:hypothetical protein